MLADEQIRIANGVTGSLSIGGSEIMPNYAEIANGGIDQFFVLDISLTDEQISEYDETRVVSDLSYYSDIVEFWSLGEDIFPLVKGIKENVDGVLINGYITDFRENK